jgi:hypothetical protein
MLGDMKAFCGMAVRVKILKPYCIGDVGNSDVSVVRLLTLALTALVPRGLRLPPPLRDYGCA